MELGLHSAPRGGAMPSSFKSLTMAFMGLPVAYSSNIRRTTPACSGTISRRPLTLHPFPSTTLRPSRTFDPAARARVKRDADALMEKFAGYFAPAAEAA